MTMIDQMHNQPEPPFAATITPMDVVDKLRVDLEGQKTINDGLRTTINNHRNSVRDLYTQLNDYIVNESLDESGSIQLSELDEILEAAFGQKLTFLKSFDVEIEWTVRASLTIQAVDADSARSIAEDISFDDPELDIDEDTTEINSIDTDAEGVRSCRQQ